jgi:hypothetical protein
MPTLPQGRLLVLCSSLVFSCVAMGISINLLRSPIPDLSSGPSYMSNWRWFPNFSPRDDHGPPTFDRSGFRVVQILATVSSASNLFVAAVLLGASFSKRKNMLAVVAVEAPLLCLSFRLSPLSSSTYSTYYRCRVISVASNWDIF